MKKFTKSLLAAAMLAGAGAANAAIVTGAGGANELFLSVYDPNVITDAGTGAKGRTFNLDLNVTFDQVKANPTAAFGSINLAGNATWANFLAGSSGSGLQYIVVGGSALPQTTASILTTNKTGFAPQVAALPITANQAALNIDTHAGEINVGTLGADSSIINDTPATPFKGQMNHLGALANGYWNGFDNNSPLVDFGTQAIFSLVGYHTEAGVDEFGDPTLAAVTRAEDIKVLGKFLLTSTGLTFTAAGGAPVPLPAAVWMFGAGLMGVLRASRRKSA